MTAWECLQIEKSAVRGEVLNVRVAVEAAIEKAATLGQTYANVVLDIDPRALSKAELESWAVGNGFSCSWFNDRSFYISWSYATRLKEVRQPKKSWWRFWE